MWYSLGTECFKIVLADSNRQESLRSIVKYLPFPNLKNTRYSLGSLEIKEGDEKCKHLNYSPGFKRDVTPYLIHTSFNPNPIQGKGENQWLLTLSLLSHQGRRRLHIYQ